MGKYGKAGRTTDDNIKLGRKDAFCIQGNSDNYTDTPIIFNIYCFSAATMVTRTRLNIMLYIHCLSYVVMELENLFLVRLRENAILDLMRKK